MQASVQLSIHCECVGRGPLQQAAPRPVLWQSPGALVQTWIGRGDSGNQMGLLGGQRGVHKSPPKWEGAGKGDAHM